MIKTVEIRSCVLSLKNTKLSYRLSLCLFITFEGKNLATATMLDFGQKFSITVSPPLLYLVNNYSFLIIPSRHTRNCSTWGSMTAWNTPRWKILELKVNHPVSKSRQAPLERIWEQVVQCPLNKSKYMTYWWILQLLGPKLVSIERGLFRTSPSKM